MATMVKGLSVSGSDGYIVYTEVQLLDGQPMTSIIGMGDQAVKEAANRIESAINETGYVYPKKRVIINLAPGDKKKRGAQYDLAMAICLLVQNNSIFCNELDKYAFVGELSLNGDLRACSGVLPMIIAAKNNGIRDVIIPNANYDEAHLVKGVNIHAFDSLHEVILFLEKGIERINENDRANIERKNDNDNLDFSDVKGHTELIEAVVIAACGGHNMLMIGEPGCGKTMIASRIPSILPEMSDSESLEVTKIHSISGMLKDSNHGLIKIRPFRAPHHNVSMNALIGGGVNALPGEVSLAHNGVLFLDELTEYSRKTLDALRQPIEDKKVTISRVNGINTYPANFMFVTAMNPCQCGYYPSSKCRCTDYEIIKYRNRISGPIMDRIDIQKNVNPVKFFDIANTKSAPSSSELRGIVIKTREIQMERFKDIEGVYCNSQMTSGMIQKFCRLDDGIVDFMKRECEKYGYSARTIHKLLRLSRTIADIHERNNISMDDVAKALTMRELDRSNNELVIVK